MNDKNDKAFDKQIEHQVKWINENLQSSEAWLKEQELFYRATNYRGS